jgi:hypothetical protein
MINARFLAPLVFLAACSPAAAPVQDQDEALPAAGAETPLATLFATPGAPSEAEPNAAPPQAASGPSFDCAKASNEVERAICGDGGLGRLDGEVARAYRDARARFQGEREAQAALQADQRNWLSGRDWSMFPGAGVGLDSYLSERAADLSAYTGPRASLSGRWSNVLGTFDIAVRDNRATISASAVEPTRSTWICQIEGEATRSGETLTLAPPDAEGWTIILTRQGSTLRVTETPHASGEPSIRPYCGNNGRFEGIYLPTAG